MTSTEPQPGPPPAVAIARTAEVIGAALQDWACAFQALARAWTGAWADAWTPGCLRPSGDPCGGPPLTRPDRPR